MDIQNLSIKDLSSNPELLEELKSKALSGSRLDSIAKDKMRAFVAENFHNSQDAALLLGELKPSLGADFGLIFLDKHGIDTDAESFLRTVRSSQRSHYLKPIEPANSAPTRSNDAKMPKDNPWKKGAENRTHQLIAIRDLPPETVAKMKREAGAKV